VTKKGEVDGCGTGILVIGLILAALLALVVPAQAAGTSYCNQTDPCWQVGVQTVRDGVDTVLTFTVTPLCKDVSYVAFGFPAEATIVSPSDGATYTGPLTGLPFVVTIPASGQVPGNAVKFAPPGASWNPNVSEQFTVRVTGLAEDAPVTLYLHAGGGPDPVVLTLLTGCGPNAVTMTRLTARSSSLWALLTRWLR
jgi:hypothetical protein